MGNRELGIGKAKAGGRGWKRGDGTSGFCFTYSRLPIPDSRPYLITPGNPGAGLSALLRSMVKVRCLASSGVAKMSPLRL